MSTKTKETKEIIVTKEIQDVLNDPRYIDLKDLAKSVRSEIIEKDPEKSFMAQYEEDIRYLGEEPRAVFLQHDERDIVIAFISDGKENVGVSLIADMADVEFIEFYVCPGLSMDLGIPTLKYDLKISGENKKYVVEWITGDPQKRIDKILAGKAFASITDKVNNGTELNYQCVNLDLFSKEKFSHQRTNYLNK